MTFLDLRLQNNSYKVGTHEGTCYSDSLPRMTCKKVLFLKIQLEFHAS